MDLGVMRESRPNISLYYKVLNKVYNLMDTSVHLDYTAVSED